MRRGLRYAGVLLAVALVMAGCSDDDEPEATPVASASPTPSETPPEPPPEPVDPCGLLTVEELAAAGIEVDMEATQRGLFPDPHTTACLMQTPKGDGWAVAYGFSLRPRVSARQAVDDLGTDKPVRLGVGDRASLGRYHAYGDTVWHAWADQGPYAVMLELFEKPRPAKVEQLLGRLLEQVEPAMLDFPMDLPASCPSPRSRQVRSVLGVVYVATGSDRDDELRCEYATRKGALLELTSDPFATAEKSQRTARQVAEYFEPGERSTPVRGTTLYVSADQYGGFSMAYVSRPPAGRGTSIERRTPIGMLWGSLEYDQQKYRAFAEWWGRQR